jgi:hypothetical protein
MVRFSVRFLLVVVLVLIGWSVGKAQARASDFELRLVTEKNGALLTCVRGCKLTHELRTPEGATVTKDLPKVGYKLNCTEQARTCTSEPIGGWVVGQP